MAAAAFDPKIFRATQRASWSSVAAGWRAWWPVFEAAAGPLSERMIECARIAPGARVLDVATGIGEPALGAARRVGPRGLVVATDLSPAMLALARERARAAGVDRLEPCEADAEDLPFIEASFDAALSRWGLMLLGDPARALAGIRSALRPGARLAVAVWAEAERAPFIAIPIEVAARELGLDPPPPGTPGPLSMGRAGDLEARLSRAGFSDVAVQPVAVAMEFTSAAEYVRFLQDLSSTLRKALEARPSADGDRVWSAIERAALRHARPGGRIRFENESLLAVGTR